MLGTKSFEDIEISTKTVIGKSNWKINITDLFNILPITDYIVLPRKRGRRPKNEKPIEPQIPLDGSIVTLKFKDKLRGVNLKGPKKSSKGPFRNSLTVVMYVDSKFINVKLSKNGTFQCTGTKTESNLENFIRYIYQYTILSKNTKALTINTNPCFVTEILTSPQILLSSVMTNINFNIGFNVNRECLDEYINNNTELYSLLETSFGYTGVNIKIPLVDMNDIPVIKMVYINDEWVSTKITYETYISMMDEKDKKKEMSKVRYNTFLVFQSGNVILSSPHKNCMKNVFKNFGEVIEECRGLIEEKLF